MGEAVEFFHCNGFSKVNEIIIEENGSDDSWFEEEIDVDLKWSFALNK